MEYSPNTKATWEELRTVAFGSVLATYAALGAPLAKSALIMRIVNRLDKDVILSFDGVTDHIYIAPSESLMYDLSSNRSGSKLVIPTGTQIYQKRGAGGASSSGALYVMLTYGAK